MKSKYNKIIFFIALFCSLYSFSYAKQVRVDKDEDIQNAILVHINQYRQHHGLSALKMDNAMVKEAQKHSMDMANHSIPFGHQYFKDRVHRLHKHIKNFSAAAENVAYNYKDAKNVVDNWVRSPGHRRNIKGNYNLTGVGIARDKKGKIYFTQIFLKIN